MRRLRFSLLMMALLSAPATTLFAQTDAVEADAQEYTQSVMRHDQLLLKFNMHLAGKEAQEEMARLQAMLAAIKAKYAPGRVPAAVAAAFQKRIRELSTEVIAPARKDWVVDVFPEPAAVAAAYKEDVEEAAAMQVLARTLEDKIGKPPTASSSAKIDRYRAAWAKINPHSRADYTARLDAIDKLRRSGQFTVDVLRKFVPVYAVEAGNQLGKERSEAAVVSDKQRFRSALFTVVGLILAVPILDLIWGERRRRIRRPGASGETTPYQLPAELDYVRIFRKSYPLSFTCGKITEIKSSTTETTYSSFTPGSGPFEPAHWSEATVRKTELDFQIERPDGGISSLHFPMALSIQLPSAAPGHLYSAVSSGKTVVLCYNHTTGWFWPNEIGIRKANRMPVVWLWLASIVIAFVGLLAVERLFVVGTTLDTFLSTPDVRATIVLTVPFAAIYIGIIAVIVQLIRVRQFKAKWPAPMEKFMEQLTAPLKQQFGSEDRARARVEKIIAKHRAKQ